MPITFGCECGKQLRVPDESAGKRARCPECGEVVSVPAGQFEPVEEPPRKVAARVVSERDDEEERPRRRSRRNDEDDDDRPRRRSRREDDEEDRPRKKKRKKKKVSRLNRDPEEAYQSNNKIMAGVAVMVIAVVWLVAGLFFGWLFYFPPFLFLAGLIQVIVALASPSNND